MEKTNSQVKNKIINRFTRDCPNHLECINEMLECPKLYLIGYYDDLKAKIDIYFVTKLRKNRSEQLKQETNKKWTRIIQIVEKCLEKCINNKIPSDVANRTKQLIANESEFEPLKIKIKLESYLLTNDSGLAMFVPNFEREIQTVEVKSYDRRVMYGGPSKKKEEVFVLDK